MICKDLPEMELLADGRHHTKRLRKTKDVEMQPVAYGNDAVEPGRWRAASLLGEIRSLHAVIRRLESELEISRQKEIQATHDARHDTLTGLPNRLFLDCWLDHVLDTSSAEVRCVAMFVDMDGFKTVNDSHGHQAGDQLLKAVALRLRETAEEDALVARYGGDEFLVLLPGPACPATARRLAERLVRSLCRPFDIDGLVIEIGASVGVAVAPPHGLQKQMLLRQADAALYAAKAYGGGNVQVFQPCPVDGIGCQAD